MQWTSAGIQIWYFPRPQIPSSIAIGQPDPSTFGLPMANFAGDCDFDAHFFNHSIIFDTTFCGTYAGPEWGSQGCSMADPSNVGVRSERPHRRNGTDSRAELDIMQRICRQQPRSFQRHVLASELPRRLYHSAGSTASAEHLVVVRPDRLFHYDTPGSVGSIHYSDDAVPGHELAHDNQHVAEKGRGRGSVGLSHPIRLYPTRGERRASVFGHGTFFSI